MIRALLAGTAVALAAALYGAQAPSEPATAPLPAASPGGYCTTPGAMGARGDRVYLCAGSFPFTWRPVK